MRRVGLFHADAQGQYTSTDLGDTLRADVPGSLASFVQLELGEAHHSAWGDLVHAVRSGRPAFDKAVGKTFTVTRILPTPSPSSVIEAAPAPLG